MILVLARIPFKIWQICSFFSMPSCSPCLCSFIFTGPARICGVTMSHNISRIFLTFSFIFARFGRFGGFVSAVSLVSLVSVVSVVSFRSFRSFRWFRFGRFVSLFRVLVHAVWGSSPNFTIQSGRNNTFYKWTTALIFASNLTSLVKMSLCGGTI